MRKYELFCKPNRNINSNKYAWVQIPALPLISCVTFKLVSGPHFLSFFIHNMAFQQHIPLCIVIISWN